MPRKSPFRTTVIKNGGDERLLADSRGTYGRKKELMKDLNSSDL